MPKSLYFLMTLLIRSNTNTMVVDVVEVSQIRVRCSDACCGSGRDSGSARCHPYAVSTAPIDPHLAIFFHLLAIFNSFWRLSAETICQLANFEAGVNIKY